MSEKTYEKVAITTDYITLGQLLKFKNVISSGSEAKIFVHSHSIKVNDNLTQERGKKLYPEFKIEIDDSMFFEITK